MRTDINYLCQVLKKTLEGNNEIRVEFSNENDNVNYILDVVKLFRKALLSEPSQLTEGIDDPEFDDIYDDMNSLITSLEVDLKARDIVACNLWVFKLGRRIKMLQSQSIPEQDRWISVEDRLPEVDVNPKPRDGGKFIDDICFLEIWGLRKDGIKEYFREYNEKHDLLYKIKNWYTHWYPIILPQPPVK